MQSHRNSGKCPREHARLLAIAEQSKKGKRSRGEGGAAGSAAAAAGRPAKAAPPPPPPPLSAAAAASAAAAMSPRTRGWARQAAVLNATAAVTNQELAFLAATQAAEKAAVAATAACDNLRRPARPVVLPASADCDDVEKILDSDFNAASADMDKWRAGWAAVKHHATAVQARMTAETILTGLRLKLRQLQAPSPPLRLASPSPAPASAAKRRRQASPSGLGLDVYGRQSPKSPFASGCARSPQNRHGYIGIDYIHISSVSALRAGPWFMFCAHLNFLLCRG
jgi:hypothetical protein